VELDASSSADVQLNTVPVGDESAVPTSLFQSNLTGIRVLKFVNWKLTRAAAVKMITGAVYA
jgi:hypothetical protein